MSGRNRQRRASAQRCNDEGKKDNDRHRDRASRRGAGLPS